MYAQHTQTTQSSDDLNQMDEAFSKLATNIWHNLSHLQQDDLTVTDKDNLATCPTKVQEQAEPSNQDIKPTAETQDINTIKRGIRKRRQITGN